MTLRSMGSIHLADLARTCDHHGYEHLPYPFMPETISRRDGHNTDESPPFSDRFDRGDPRIVREWMEAYARADIWVECRVIHSYADTLDTRILAFRAGTKGFFATQQPNTDTVEVFELSPYELGAAVASSVGLTKSGSHPRIVIPKYVNYFREPANDTEAGDGEFSVLRPVRSTRAGANVTVVSNAEVTALAIVQSHCEPARGWGIDWDKKFVPWVHVRDDGDYIYTADFSHAAPLTEKDLSDRIDRLIAHDVAVLRERLGSY
ncbi:ESX secretion-associated protein EspG [Mycobacterium talmoniae]|uniref:ESX secretion-associated protein EspG n=1 Tax=Mycobacterium talmoniae TaxID=1858794 RepID=UPI0013F4CA11|nr:MULTISPECIES: ESX secretion-associated protein EspG [Mycobacterium]